jgi:hypothetical protein
MYRKLIGMLGVVSAFMVPQAVSAAPAMDAHSALKVESYADLLAPIPNAATILTAVDSESAANPSLIQKIQYYHHHHHHHHYHVVPRPLRRFFYHHHHHHHYHHHHHHHYY